MSKTGDRRNVSRFSRFLSGERSVCPRFCAAVLVLALLPGCGGFGRVNQGQVIAYDREKGLVTLISDSNYREPGKPKFDVLPPITVRVPENAGEMGAAPAAGRLMRLDTRTRHVVVFDSAAQDLKTIGYSPVEQHLRVAGDDGCLKAVAFPAVDRQRKTVTVYARREQALVTFTVPDEFLAWPEDAWREGDEIRYYYKDPAQALRLMNVTRTEIGKAGK